MNNITKIKNTNQFVDINKLKKSLDPISILKIIGYEKSNPVFKGYEVRDFCPIHLGDSQRSLCINTNSGEFKCHSCGEHGDLIELYCLALNKEFLEAIRELEQEPVNYKTKATTTKEIKKDYSANDVIKCWATAKTNGNDFYFIEKKLPVLPNVRFGKNPFGYQSIMMSWQDINNNFVGITCLQSGPKFNYLVRENLNGAFVLLGNLEDARGFFIGEGVATVASIWEAYNRKCPAVSVGSWSNLKAALFRIKDKYPELKPIILLDLGIEKDFEKDKKEIEEKFNDVIFVKPDFDGLPNIKNEKLTDFNDLISKCGLSFNKVKEQLKEQINKLKG